MSMTTTDDVLSNMEEARKSDTEITESIKIIIDKQLTIRENAVFNTKCLIPNVKISLFSKDKIIETSKKITKCKQCYCDMEKNVNLKDDDGSYYCSLCWEDWDGKNVLAPSFIEKWGYEYEKVEIDY